MTQRESEMTHDELIAWLESHEFGQTARFSSNVNLVLDREWWTQRPPQDHEHYTEDSLAVGMPHSQQSGYAVHRWRKGYYDPDLYPTQFVDTPDEVIAVLAALLLTTTP